MAGRVDKLLLELQNELKDGLLLHEIGGDKLFVEVAPAAIGDAAKSAKRAGFDFFSYVTAVDRGKELELVYRLSALDPTEDPVEDLVIKAHLPRTNPTVASLTGLYKGANWQEREVYDLFGVEFEGHPNLTRILLPDDWLGYPLRKDYEDEKIEPRPKVY